MTTALHPEESFFRPDELQEIRRAFFDQGREAVQDLDRGVLQLENQEPTTERLKPLRRSAHTLKSDCATVGFPGLSTLSHALEDALVALERARGTVGTADVDVLLAAVDQLRLGFEAGMRGEPEPDVRACLARLGTLGGAGSDSALVAVHVASRSRRRATEAVVARAVARLALEVVSREARGDGGVTVVARAAEHADALRARARRLRLQVEIEDRTPRGRAADAPAAPEAPIDAAADGETVRVEAARVDEVLTLVGEMVIARSAIAGVASELEGWLPPEQATRLGDAQALLGRVLQDLQRSAMRMRMVPADRVFRRFTRVVRDLARRTGKQFRLRIEGETTELDRGILDALEEPLLHLVRNAGDHAIESADERLAAGKSPEGSIVLKAGREGNQVVIEVSDDGRGIDPQVVRRLAVERGLLEAQAAQALSDADAVQLVFLPGFSTAREVTETSGRGVGLDVVRETVESLKGSVRAETRPGAGASFVIRVPLTVAIIRALLFQSGGRDLAVPLTTVVEIARVEELLVQHLGDRDVFRRRDEVLGLVRVSDLMGVEATDAGRFVIVVQCGAGRFGLLVDRLDGEHELVIKAVHDRWIRTPLVAGASVLASGGLVLILDVPALHRAALGRGVLA